MSELPSLRSERLLLSELRVSDIPQIVTYANNLKVTRYTKNIPFPYTEKDAVFWLNLANGGIADGSKYVWAIRNPVTKAFMGGIGLHVSAAHQHAELGYWIAEPFWGQGFMSEAVGAVIKFGFEAVGLARICAHYISINTASGRVMEKNGMKLEGTLRQHMFRGGELHDIKYYGILREEYVAK